MKVPIYIALLLFSHLVTAQREVKKHIITGNQLYDKGQYSKAEENYQKALITDPKSYEGAFNKADALYKQQKYAESADHFRALAEKSNDKKVKAGAYHNLGNSLLQAQDFEKSIEAYKNALRNNPNDNYTRYNLAYAMKMLKQQQNQQNNQNQPSKNDQKENQQQERKEKNDQQKNDERKDDNQLSREDMQRLLDALNNEEKKLQENANKHKAKGAKVQIEKDW